MKILLAAILLLSASPAFAQQSETLSLYPKSREVYMQKSQDRADRYQAEGYNYIENLYEYRGEGGASAEPRMTDAEADAAIESVNKSTTPPETDAPPASPAR